VIGFFVLKFLGCLIANVKGSKDLWRIEIVVHLLCYFISQKFMDEH